MNNFDSPVYLSATLYVPDGSKPVMEQTTPWRYFLNIVEYDFASLDEISIEDEAVAEYYDLNGRRILSPSAGQILIRRCGSNVSKIIF